MILLLQVLVGLIIFIETVGLPLVVLFRQPSGQKPKSAFLQGLYLDQNPSSRDKTFALLVNTGLIVSCLILYFIQGSFGFLLIGTKFFLVVLSRNILKDYRASFGDERDFDLTLRARSASLAVTVGLLMLYFITFPTVLDAFSVMAGFYVARYLLELVFVYLINAAQNRELETEEA
jgi:hypothetical protein